jgi:hypothetical protein
MYLNCDAIHSLYFRAFIHQGFTAKIKLGGIFFGVRTNEVYLTFKYKLTRCESQ